MCWSEGTSTHQHNKILVSGTVGTFQLCSDKQLDQFSDLQGTRCQTDTMSLSPGNCMGTAGTASKVPQPAKPAAVLLQPPSKLCNAINNAN